MGSPPPLWRGSSSSSSTGFAREEKNAGISPGAGRGGNGAAPGAGNGSHRRHSASNTQDGKFPPPPPPGALGSQAGGWVCGVHVSFRAVVGVCWNDRRILSGCVA